MSISKNNQILLSKLVEISSGKRSMLPQITPTTHGRSVFQARASQPASSSLNLLVRKRETDRIEKENHAIARRLFDKQPVLRKVELDRAWNDHLKLKR
jgi:hypothetical protein